MSTLGLSASGAGLVSAETQIIPFRPMISWTPARETDPASLSCTANGHQEWVAGMCICTASVVHCLGQQAKEIPCKTQWVCLWTWQMSFVLLICTATFGLLLPELTKV